MLSQFQEAMQRFENAKRCFDDACFRVDPAKDPIMWDICQGLAALAEGLSELVSGLDQVQTAQNYTLNRIENSLNEVLNKIRQI
jgi:X-X-X-Leu-X-X-Gly heptad repeat protein